MDEEKRPPRRLSNAFFTYNNPTVSLQLYADLIKPKAKYFKIQLERGAEGTPHIQGVIKFTSQVSFNRAKNILGTTVHLEPVQDWPKAMEYCGKEDTRVEGPIEYGERPMQGKRSDLEEVAGKILTGSTLEEGAESNPCQYIRYHRGLTALRGRVIKPRTFKTQVILLTGPTGSGKTSSAYQMLNQHGTPYFKRGEGPWWDGYDAHPTVLWDEFTYEPPLRKEYLNLFDRYPHQVPIKGGFVPFCAHTIVLTCLQWPFPVQDPEITRRLTLWIEDDDIQLDRRDELNDESEPSMWASLRTL